MSGTERDEGKRRDSDVADISLDMSASGATRSIGEKRKSRRTQGVHPHLSLITRLALQVHRAKRGVVDPSLDLARM